MTPRERQTDAIKFAAAIAGSQEICGNDTCDRYKVEAARRIKTQADRIVELDGAAITDAAADRFIRAYYPKWKGDKRDIDYEGLKKAFLAALRSESHQASDTESRNRPWWMSAWDRHEA